MLVSLLILVLVFGLLFWLIQIPGIDVGHGIWVH